MSQACAKRLDCVVSFDSHMATVKWIVQVKCPKQVTRAGYKWRPWAR